MSKEGKEKGKPSIPSKKATNSPFVFPKPIGETIPINTPVFVQYPTDPPDQKTLAQIIECRAGQIGNEYYVHFLGLDRRNDKWVPETYIFNDEETVREAYREMQTQKEEEKKEEDSFLFNDEHCMDEKNIEEHEQATKIKTIGSVEFGKH